MPSRKRAGFVQDSGAGCTISIDASPGAPRTEISGVNEWRGALQVKIAAAARQGEANEELVSFLSEKLRVDPKAIRILKGERSSSKVVFVPLPAEKVKAILGVG